MRVLLKFCIPAALLFLPWPALAQAQTPPAEELLAQRHQEVVEWLDEYHRWEAWMMKWANRVAYNAAGGLIKKRPERPEPPAWLWEDCQSVLAAEGTLGEACLILQHWDDLPRLLAMRKAVAGVTPQSDQVVKTSFLQRVHLSGGWVPAQLPAPKIYLVAGMQVGIVEVGRLTLPAVGVGLMTMADGNGGYEWKPATVIGIGYRLSSFPFPWVSRQAHLHINIARVTIHGMRNIPVGIDPSQNLVGFSLTFSKAR